MATSPDPIAEAAAYRAMLLGLCGRDDPAEVQGGAPDDLRRLLLEAEGRLRTVRLRGSGRCSRSSGTSPMPSSS